MSREGAKQPWALAPLVRRLRSDPDLLAEFVERTNAEFKALQKAQPSGSPTLTEHVKRYRLVAESVVLERVLEDIFAKSRPVDVSRVSVAPFQMTRQAENRRRDDLAHVKFETQLVLFMERAINRTVDRLRRTQPYGDAVSLIGLLRENPKAIDRYLNPVARIEEAKQQLRFNTGVGVTIMCSQLAVASRLASEHGLDSAESLKVAKASVAFPRKVATYDASGAQSILKQLSKGGLGTEILVTTHVEDNMVQLSDGRLAPIEPFQVLAAAAQPDGTIPWTHDVHCPAVDTRVDAATAGLESGIDRHGTVSGIDAFWNFAADAYGEAGLFDPRIRMRESTAMQQRMSGVPTSFGSMGM